MQKIILKPGREKALVRRHPWIFSGAIADIVGNPEPGQTVEIHSAQKNFLAYAAFNPHSQIAARVWDWQQDTHIDKNFFVNKLVRSIMLRKDLIRPDISNAIRLVYAESDGLPGLIVDQYADTLVMQTSSAGAWLWRDTLADILMELTGATRIMDRSDTDMMQMEGLPSNNGLLRGTPLNAPLEIFEYGLSFYVDVVSGQKTGFYLDQRDNRAKISALARNKDMLNCFCYSGGFSVHALAQSARSVISIDSSADALAWAQKNVALNKLSANNAEYLEQDVFQQLRRFRDQAKSFDMIILDPPKFALSASHVERAARAYKDINLLAFKLLRPGGLLATFSCSGAISSDLFQKIVAGAALDANVDAQIIESLHAAPDHPVALNFPEAAYLKGLICRVAS